VAALRQLPLATDVPTTDGRPRLAASTFRPLVCTAGISVVPLWRPDDKPPRDQGKILGYCGVGRKPS